MHPHVPYSLTGHSSRNPAPIWAVDNCGDKSICSTCLVHAYPTHQNGPAIRRLLPASCFIAAASLNAALTLHYTPFCLDNTGLWETHVQLQGHRPLNITLSRPAWLVECSSNTFSKWQNTPALPSNKYAHPAAMPPLTRQSQKQVMKATHITGKRGSGHDSGTLMG